MLAKDDFYAEVGARIKRARVRRKLAQKTVAHQLEISRTTLANIEGGRQSVQAYILAQLAGILRVSVVSLYPASAVPDEGAVPDVLRDRPTAGEWYRRVIGKEPS
jgi:transcriptional regulator with XRE-family HTH domain